ncbi:hypothetical protein K439DRAFT_1616609 [Ramaria rubella]|nr:hypothetical protein K439DRAFT_1616609 [Ramaria rubella]
MVLDSNVQFQGRWDLEGEDRYSTHWCGSLLRFQTTSRSVTLQLGGLTEARGNYHNVLWRFGTHSVTRTILVRGNRAMVLTPSGGSGEGQSGEVLLDVTVMLCDWGATLQVLDITTTDGRPILPPAVGPPMRPLLFIGASLVSGFSPPFKGLVLPHGSHQAFGSIAVRTLRAEGIDTRLEMVAYPGLRLMTTEHDKGMEDVFWEGVGGLGGWEYRSKDSPHDIFVCLGTLSFYQTLKVPHERMVAGANDQGWGADKSEFLQRYKLFLVRLRDSYPNTVKRIFVISPFGIFTDPVDPKSRLLVFEPDVQQMVEDLAQSWLASNPNGVKLRHIDTEGWIDKSLTCDGLHPTVEGHEKIGAKVVEILKAAA